MDSTEKLIINYLVICYLKDGLSQQEIAERLKQNDIKPNSLSSVEKKLKQIKEYYEAKNLFHLACILRNNKLLVNAHSRNGE
ncbi:helix-turn-helix transcriptional regulator [Chryseobacterium indologenes]|uniref:helix-turn-helix transcriptional regulator n=1 Tax=Chryseobacterium indologenes TaxID=253 RepID=UPI001626E5A1|nr:hypothetical protein [Chryseobacterium indologenes]